MANSESMLSKIRKRKATFSKEAVENQLLSLRIPDLQRLNYAETAKEECTVKAENASAAKEVRTTVVACAFTVHKRRTVDSTVPELLKP
ncbi:hypothetical protein L596_017045 [Steinernema carpocapsae]|uniref:Uncharacterized protein n=1 Tax=Steinernema carpocapsae TaxID=34508 RepID=A0A4U5N167_STECR|nr:hypothetical protein L596_017045 [Steinernema carpocapsae]